MPTSLTYVGEHPEVEIPALGGVVVKHGETFEVDDADVAKSLLEQKSNFTRAAAKSKGA